MFQWALMRHVCESTPCMHRAVIESRLAHTVSAFRGKFHSLLTSEQSSQHLQMTGVTGREGRHFAWHSFFLAAAVQSCALPPAS